MGYDMQKRSFLDNDGVAIRRSGSFSPCNANRLNVKFLTKMKLHLQPQVYDKVTFMMTGIFFALLIERRRNSARCYRSSFPILIILFSGPAYIKYIGMLPVYIDHKDGTFHYRTHLFHAPMSHSLRAPTNINHEICQKWAYLFGSAINVARAL